MKNLKTYNDMEVSLLHKTPNPGQTVLTAVKLTQSKMIEPTVVGASEKLLRFLTEAEHTSVLEHVNMCFGIEGVSRAFLAQITRHRMASYTSASQHYSNYADMPMVVHPDHVDEFKEYQFTHCHTVDALVMDDEYVIEYDTALEIASKDYNQMVENGVPIYEARMILPNAATVNLMWTINARSLATFLAQRLCKRNVAEMHMFAVKVLDLLNEYWPEYAAVIGPQCRTDWCKQGKMSCGEPYARYPALKSEG